MPVLIATLPGKAMNWTQHVSIKRRTVNPSSGQSSPQITRADRYLLILGLDLHRKVFGSLLGVVKHQIRKFGLVADLEPGFGKVVPEDLGVFRQTLLGDVFQGTLLFQGFGGDVFVRIAGLGSRLDRESRWESRKDNLGVFFHDSFLIRGLT